MTMSNDLLPKGAVAPRTNGECPKTHKVKGNQSGIYHSPGMPNYTQTIAEACFDCEDCAEKADFRRPENVDGTASREGHKEDYEHEELRILELTIKQAGGKTRSGKSLPKGSVPSFWWDEEGDGKASGHGGSGHGGSGSGGSGSDSGSHAGKAGSGDYRCPRSHPVKGNEQSDLYHVPGGASYKLTIPEFCFKTPKDAEAAGFTAASR